MISHRAIFGSVPALVVRVSPLSGVSAAPIPAPESILARFTTAGGVEEILVHTGPLEVAWLSIEPSGAWRWLIEEAVYANGGWQPRGSRLMENRRDEFQGRIV